MTTRTRTVKCVVWDLDNTLWHGVLLEGDEISLRPGIVQVIETLDQRGILHSVASRNDQDDALDKLRQFGIDEYFLFPRINWGPKSESVAGIARSLNIGLDALAFVDDDPFERDEVSAGVPGLLCIDAADALLIPDMAEMQPQLITEDTRNRRAMYQAEILREQAAEGMAPDEFLRSLGMVFTIDEASASDLARVEELVTRTNQLNSTGVTYSFSELDGFRRSPDHLLLVAGLEDRYGTYGKIGIALVDLTDDAWQLRLLLMSCRVMSRGVGKVLLSHILQEAATHNKPVRADFVRTKRNRPMFLTFKLAGFRELDRVDGIVRLEHDLSVIDPVPDYVDVRIA